MRSRGPRRLSIRVAFLLARLALAGARTALEEREREREREREERDEVCIECEEECILLVWLRRKNYW